MNDIERLRSYVTASDHMQYANLADGLVQVDITHSNLLQRGMEVRLSLHMTISEVKQKLYSRNGTKIEFMHLQLLRKGNLVCILEDDSKPLGFYSVQNGDEIHVIDNDPFSLSKNGGLEDVSQVKKYEMSDEAYNARSGTLREYKKKMLEKDPNFRFFPDQNSTSRSVTKDTSRPDVNYSSPECIVGLSVDSRCEVDPGARRGVIKWIGNNFPAGDGYWVGVLLDEPLGKGNGTRNGISYFSAPELHGAFVRPDYVRVGDYPEEEL